MLKSMICQIQRMHTLAMRSKVIQRKIDISGYTFVKAEDLKVGTDNEKNIVKVYYSKDDNKDNIPDKYRSHSLMSQQMIIKEL